MSSLTDALIYLHNHCILHNNINVSNLLVNTENGTALFIVFSHAWHEENSYYLFNSIVPMFGEECCCHFNVVFIALALQALICTGIMLKGDNIVCKYISWLGRDCISKDKQKDSVLIIMPHKKCF